MTDTRTGFPVIRSTYAGRASCSTTADASAASHGSGRDARSAARPGDSDDGRDGVAGLPDAAPRVEPEQEHRAEHEEDDQRDDRRPVGAGDLEDHAEQERAEPRRAALAGVVEREVLALAAAGDEQAEERPGQRLGAAQHDRRSRPPSEQEESRRSWRGRNIASTTITIQAKVPHEDAPVGAVRSRPAGRRAARRRRRRTGSAGSSRSAPTVAEARAAWSRTSTRRRSRSGCRRCRRGRRPGRSASSGSCRISRSVVNSWPKLRCSRPPGSGTTSPGRVVAQPQERDEREAGPPQRRREQREPDRQLLVEADGVVAEEHHQVDAQQQPAAEVAQRPAARGDPVALVLGGDVDQDRVVADQRAAAEDAADHDRDRAELPVVALA